MAGFWELMANYRELTNQKGAFRITEKELGLMRDLDPKNQKDTVVMKLARKRFLEFTSSQKQFPANLERVIKESEDLAEEALKQCENGSKSIDPQVLAMDAATNTGKGTFTETECWPCLWIVFLFIHIKNFRFQDSLWRWDIHSNKVPKSVGKQLNGFKIAFLSWLDLIIINLFLCSFRDVFENSFL